MSISPTITPPSSKSITNRVVALAGMSRRTTTIKNFCFSNDTTVGIECLKKLGFEIQTHRAHSIRSTMTGENSTHLPFDVHISPPNFSLLNAQNFYNQTFELDMCSSGTMARFFPAVILNWTKTFPESKPIHAIFNASPQLQRRPILPIINALKKLNAKIEGETYPFKISSSNLMGETNIDTTQSSQFLSGLLMATCGSKNKVSIARTGVLPQHDYVDMSVNILSQFGAHITYTNKLDNFCISPTEELFCNEFFVEPDASTACYYLALAFIHNQSLTIEGLGSKSLQPDVQFCDFLKKMGAHIDVNENEIRVFKRTDSIIFGGFSYDFSLMSDQALTAGVLALFANAPIEITNIAHIRNHESDRISCIANNFKKFQFNIEEKKNGFCVNPKENQFKSASGVWETHDDHRFAMSGFLLSSLNSKIILKNPQCVAKTAPNFFNDANQLLSNFSFH